MQQRRLLGYCALIFGCILIVLRPVILSRSRCHQRQRQRARGYDSTAYWTILPLVV